LAARSRLVHRPGQTRTPDRAAGVAGVLFQEPDVGARARSRTRAVAPVGAIEADAAPLGGHPGGGGLTPAADAQSASGAPQREPTLKGRTALVTGSSRGIGRAIALKLGACGADVAVNYVTRDRDAHDVVDRLQSMERRAFAMRADVSKLDELAALLCRGPPARRALDSPSN